MANTPIDELSLNINVNDKNSAAKINAVADAINNLQRSLSSLSKVGDQMKNMQNIFNSVASIQLAQQFPQYQSMLEKIEIDENGKALSSTEQLADATEDLDNKTRGMITTLQDLKREQEKANKQQREGAKDAKKSAGMFSKLAKSIGRVAFYRAIRTALKEIVQAGKEGLANIRTIDSNLDTSLNRLSQSATTLKNSFGQMLSPIIQSLEPVITRLTDGIAVIVNRISEARAAMAGQSEYTKILTSDTEEYQDAIKKAGEESKKQKGNLLSFDTFTTQSARKDSYTGVIKETVKMTKEEASTVLNTLETIEATLIAIAGVIAAIKITHIITDISKISSMLGSTSSGLGLFGSIAAAAVVITGIVTTIRGISNIINWNEQTTGAKKVADVLTVILGLIAAIAGIVGFLTGNFALVGYAAIAAAGAITAASISSAESSKIKAPGNGGGRFADGGIYDRGDFFMANENGATELVASSNTGGGSVMNLDQWARISYSSFYRALSDYNAAQNDRGGELDINSLGRTIAGNSGFVNEMNRRNSSLNLI